MIPGMDTDFAIETETDIDLVIKDYIEDYVIYRDELTREMILYVFVTIIDFVGEEHLNVVRDGFRKKRRMRDIIITLMKSYADSPASVMIETYKYFDSIDCLDGERRLAIVARL